MDYQDSAFTINAFWIGSTQKLKQLYFQFVALICCVTDVRFFLKFCKKACT